MSIYDGNYGSRQQPREPPWDPHKGHYPEHSPHKQGRHEYQQEPFAQQYAYAPQQLRQPHRGDSQRTGQRKQYGSMAGNYPQQSSAHLGATFYPGGQDDFYMPEVISPTPQRVMPEVPANMQETMELEAQEMRPQSNRMSSQSTVSSMTSPRVDQRTHSRGPSQTYQKPNGPGFTASYGHTNASVYQNLNRGQQVGGDLDAPKFSPFPRIRKNDGNVPLSDEEKEEMMERARISVLQSTDPEMQLAWAQDALSWVEVAHQDYVRQQAEGGPARPVTPKAEHQLRIDALNIVEFLAEQDHPKAVFMKGMWLEFGKFGYRVDRKAAWDAYKISAAKGYARAEYRIGMQWETSNDSVKAIQHYQRGVDLGDSAAKYRLGMMTLLGQHGMRQDYQQGVDLIQAAASTADENAPQGAYVYGMLLARELDRVSVPDHFLPYDLNEAKMFVEKAAYLGFAKAQLKMAQAFELCQLGCEFEPALSLHYNALAARQGEPEANFAISKWFLCGHEGLFEKNDELAFTYAKRAALAKMPTAEFAMGYFYEIGIYVPVDLRESESWYAKAAEHGNTDALGRIDSIGKNKALKKEDHEIVAISRIKSTHGSQRGGRPERFKQKPPPMPSMTEDNRLNMPDPRSSYLTGSGQLNPQNGVSLPVRPKSTAPYPEDDMHPPQASQAPYPNQVLRPMSLAGPQADRPSSAFGIRPLSHATTEVTGQYHSPPRDPMRPSTSMGNMPIAGGRGSNPADRGRVVPSGWEPQVSRKGLSPNRAPTIPQVDPGRPINCDQGAGRPQKQGAPNMNKAYPQNPPASQSYPSTPQDSQPPHNQGYGAGNQRPQPGRDSAVLRRDPAANQYPRPGRESSMTTTGVPHGTPVINQPPGRYESVHGQVHNAQAPTPNPNPSRNSNRPPMAGTLSSQQPQTDSRPPSAAPVKKPGPATFEEMGIPNTKQKEECIMM